jgi:hypothetical protein
MNLETIYQSLCMAAAPAAALERMGDTTLAAMIVHLEASGIESGIPGMVLGLCEREAARRFLTEHHDNHSPVGEG